MSWFWWEIPYLGKFGPKVKIVCLRWKLVPRPTWICWIWRWWSNLLFWTGNIFYFTYTNSNMVNFIVTLICPAVDITNVYVKFKFVSQANLNIFNSTVMFKLLFFASEISILGKFGRKGLNCLINMKFCTWLNSNMLSLVVMFVCLV